MSPRLLVAFVRSVAVLALPADAQVSWLHWLFADATPVCRRIGSRVRRRIPACADVHRAELARCRRAAGPEQLDAQLEAMSSERNAELWHVDALVREEWDRIRTLAMEALSLLS
jgi:hypothetical protein